MAKSKADRSGSSSRGGSGSKEKDTPSRSSGGGSSRAPKSSPRPSSKPSSSFGGGGGDRSSSKPSSSFGGGGGGSRSSSKPDRSFGGGGGGSRPSSKPSPYFGGGGGSSAAAQEVARKAAAREQAAAAPAIAAAGPGPGFASDAGKRQFEQQSVAFYGGVLPPYVPLEPTDFPGPMPGYEFGLPPLGEAATVPAATTPPGTLENMSIAEQYLSEPTVDPLTAARDPNAPTIEDYMDLVSRTTGIGSTKPVPRPDNLVAPTVPTAPARTGYVSRPTDMVVSAAPGAVSPEMVGNVAASQAAYQDMLDRLNAAQAQQSPSVQTSVGGLGSDLAMDTLPSLSSDFGAAPTKALPSSGGLSASAPSALTESVYQAAESLAPRPSAPPPPAPVPAPVPPSVLDSYSFETQPDIIEAPLSEAAVPPEMGLVPTTSRSSAAPTPEMIAADTAATSRGVPGYVGVPVVGPILGGLSNAGRAIGDVFRGDRPLFGEGGLLPPDTRTTEEIFASMRERDDNDDSGTPSFATAETAPTPETQAPAEEAPAEEAPPPYVLPPIGYATLSDITTPGAYGLTLEQYLEMLRRFPGGAQGPQVPQGLMTVAPIDSGIGSLMG